MLQQLRNLHINATKPISRVLSCAEIYLSGSSPKRFSRLYGTPAEQTLTYTYQ